MKFSKYLLLPIFALMPMLASAGMMFSADISAGQVVSPPASPLAAAGSASFYLNDAKTELSYKIKLTGNIFLSSSPRTEPAPSGVTKIHIHVGAPGSTGPHVLNVFGLPSEDDPDLVIDYATNTLTGIWGNANDIIGDPNVGGSTKNFDDFLDELLAGDLYVAIHTVNGDPGVEMRGQIVNVPEPGTLGLLGGALLGLYSLRRKRA